MKICIVNDYSIVHIGGAVTSLLEQKKALEAAGHTVFVLQLGEFVKDSKIDQTNFLFVKPSFYTSEAFYRLPFLNGSKKNYDIIRKYLVDNKIEVIHSQSEFSLSYMAMKVATELGIGKVFTIHTFFWEYRNKTALKLTAFAVKKFFELTVRQSIELEELTGNPVEQTLKNITLTQAKRSDAIISPSAHQLATIKKSSIKTPSYVVPNPFTPAEGLPQATPVNATPGQLKMVWIGRCAPEKRPLEFLEAVKKASSQTDKKIFVDIIGDGELLPAMKQKYPLKNVTYLGQQSHDQVIEHFDKADIIVLSSYHFDNQPMIIAEGITRLRPIFYCDEKLTEGLEYAGYLTKNESIEAMSEGILDLINNPEKLQVLSNGAQKSAVTFSGENFVQNVMPIYESVTKK